MNDEILKLTGITKQFPGTLALDNVQLDVVSGEVHSLCGENGAGKSTLMKIISGAHEYTSGHMYFMGEEVRFTNTAQAMQKGIAMIYQEFNLIKDLSVAENIFLGRLPKNKFGIVDWKKINLQTRELLEKFGLKISPKTKVKYISVAACQMCEIVKALSIGAKLIIMDEPTAALTNEESEVLFDTVEKLKTQGIGIIYVSHRMDEVFRISDRITVFRNGKFVKTHNTKDTNYDQIVSEMVGENITHMYPERNCKKQQEEVLKLENVSSKYVKDISFSLYKREILGLAGLQGAGNTDIGKILFGIQELNSGYIVKDGRKLTLKNPKSAMDAGIGLVPESRKDDGLVLLQSVKNNLTMTDMSKCSKMKIINKNKENKIASDLITKLTVKTKSKDVMVSSLSGGNQQKVVIGKIMNFEPDIYILTEPTRGVDIGAKAQIYKLIDEFTKEGNSVIIISSDLPEIIGMCDRVLVMKSGQIVKELLKDELSQEKVLSYASGGVNE